MWEKKVGREGGRDGGTRSERDDDFSYWKKLVPPNSVEQLESVSSYWILCAQSSKFMIFTWLYMISEVTVYMCCVNCWFYNKWCFIIRLFYKIERVSLNTWFSLYLVVCNVLAARGRSKNAINVSHSRYAESCQNSDRRV